MTQLTIKTGTEEDFFQRGRKLARAADRGEPLVDERIIRFEDPAEVTCSVSGAFPDHVYRQEDWVKGHSSRTQN